MAKLLKATVGILFTERMFRLSSLSGELIDDLLSLRGKIIDSDDFQTFERDTHNTNLRLFNERSGKYLNINLESITLTHDLYDSEANFKFDTFIAEFEAIWSAVDTRLKLPNIRRIGFVTEQRFHTGSNSNQLLVDKLTTLKTSGFPAKFHLAFEDRLNVGIGGLPDPTKDDFINVIRAYYDSSIDIEHPEEDSINANLDVQRYYSPALKSKGFPVDEVRKLKRKYDEAESKFNSELTRFGISNAKSA
jgi:hypothetical protein